MKTISASVFFLALFITACQQPGANNAPANTNANANANAATSKTETKKAATDLSQLAGRIVNQSAAVKEGEIVMISGGARDMDLLENLVIEVEKAGGYPMLEINSDNMAKRSFTEVPEKYDTKEPKLGMALSKIVNVTINVDSNETAGALSDVPPARMAARAKAGASVGKEFIKNKVRSVAVGNDLYPTEWRAKRFDMAQDAFAKLFWEGVNIDYTNLQQVGEKARTALQGKELEITPGKKHER